MAWLDARTRALAAAARLLFTDGIAVTGVDAVAREAEVSVVSLHKHFASRNGLAAAVLAHRLQVWEEVLQAEVGASAP